MIGNNQFLTKEKYMKKEKLSKLTSVCLSVIATVISVTAYADFPSSADLSGLCTIMEPDYGSGARTVGWVNGKSIIANGGRGKNYLVGQIVGPEIWAVTQVGGYYRAGWMNGNTIIGQPTFGPSLPVGSVNNQTIYGVTQLGSETYIAGSVTSNCTTVQAGAGGLLLLIW
jgi:hypothetical protein